MIGKTLGHYKVGEQLGRGGMGEVYVADDLSLDRKVALKFLPDAFTGDPERMARFEREAKVLASLNHPNIAAIHGLEQAEGKRFIVMELVEGETLAQRLSKGPLPVDEALGLCRQIAEGLEAAHEKGVIHRDLKPANVMITEGDKVKILDFGLAKALSDEILSVDSSHSPTLTEAMTRPGVILGTAAYMSPEQAKGKAVDKRADIWAFGCILYECLTGKRAFDGETVTETLAAVLTREPEWEKIPANVAPLLSRCLEKDPKKRVRDILEAMEWTQTVPESAPVKRPWLAWSAAALFFLVALAALALPYLSEKPFPQGAPIRFQIAFPDRVSPNTTGAFALSPDGRHLAFAGVGSDGVQRLWLRTLESLEARALPGTESNWISTIFWLADSRFIIFPAGGKLKKVAISGGPPQILCDLNNIIVGGSSNRDGVILFAENPSNAIRRVSAVSGDASIVIKPDPKERETYFFHPIFLPDGQHFLYLVSSRTPGKTGIYAGLLNSKPQDWPPKKILSTDFGIAYMPSQVSGTGQVLFLRDETLMAQQFDERRLELTGQEAAVAEHVGFIYGVNGYFSAAKNGTLVFRSGSLQMQQLAWFDRKGSPAGALDASGASCSGLALSPDGSRAAVSWLDSQAPQYLDLWLFDFGNGRKTRFTSGGYSYNPIWSSDGSLIVFRRDRGASIGLYRKPASGAKQEELLLNSNENKVVTPTSWSRDGRFLLYSVENSGVNNDLWVLPLEGDRKPIPFVTTEFDERNGRFSPDMRWVAYESDETGITEIYVRAFLENSAGLSGAAGGGVIVSKGGGVAPLWRLDSRELYYRAPDGKVMGVDVAAGTRFEAGTPAPLFNAPLGYWDAASDGQRFLLLTPSIESNPSPFNVILNWTSSLKK